MDRPKDTQKPGKPSTTASKTNYLIAYNLVSAVLWATVFARVVSAASLQGTREVYANVGQFTKWTQTLAALEVVHSAIGLVRAPLITTLLQVSSRFFLVWLIVAPFPSLAITHTAYSTMLLAWSTTEVIRYSYFAMNLAYGGVPGWLTWLRYNTFFVLYPLGIASECLLVYAAQGPAGKMYGTWAVTGLWVVLGIYVPGAYVLFSHMMTQRRKIMRSSGRKKAA